MWHGSMSVVFIYYNVLSFSLFWVKPPPAVVRRLEMVNRRPDKPLLINTAINLLWTKKSLFFFSLCAIVPKKPNKYWPAFFTGILGIFYAKPLHINRCLTWNDPSLCDVLYWFGIWSPPLAFFLFFRAFFSFFFSIYYYLWPSSIVKRWINPPRFISSRNSVRFWRSASVPVVVVTPEDPRPEPKGLHWTSPAFRQGVNPTLMSTWRQRLTMPFPIRLKSASTRSASTLKCSALLCGVNFGF